MYKLARAEITNKDLYESILKAAQKKNTPEIISELKQLEEDGYIVSGNNYPKDIERFFSVEEAFKDAFANLKLLVEK